MNLQYARWLKNCLADLVEQGLISSFQEQAIRAHIQEKYRLQRRNFRRLVMVLVGIVVLIGLLGVMVF